MSQKAFRQGRTFSYQGRLPISRYFILIGGALLGLVVLANGAAQGVHPPPEPAVRPMVSVPAGLDRNANRLDDALDDRLTSARAALAQSRTRSQGEQALQQPARVELIFDRQITQGQLDAFLDAGGTVTRVMEAVSYGWTGELPLANAEAVAARMGTSLLGMVEGKPLKLHMDEAARCGRVRPTVWDLGVKGLGTAGNEITVAILDTGVDGSHTDLAGRMAYWKDWTSDNHASSQDVGHHGSHVAGIAVGTGAASGVVAGPLSYTDNGKMSATAGKFYQSPIHLFQAGAVSWSSTMVWGAGSGVQAQLGHLFKTSGYGSISPATASTASPINEANAFANPFSGANTYSSFPSKLSAGFAQPAYSVRNSITYGLVTADGYNRLSGVAPQAQWAGFKVFPDSGSGSSLDIAAALDDLVSQREAYKIKVANLSLGIIGNPGIDVTTRNKVNTAAQNGVVVVCSAGNDGKSGTGSAGEGDDPGRAQYVITVAATSDVNQLTDYSSHGFAAPGDGSAGDDDTKPDICAPGGSTSFQSNILSVDSNTGDENGFADGTPNDYLNIQGTSMASPFMAGCAALVIDAMEQGGMAWHFTGGQALQDALSVKMLLLMTATETNQAREFQSTSPAHSGDPVLDRGGKDINEGYGMVNADAAVEALLNPAFNTNLLADADFGTTSGARRCWARRVTLTAGKPVSLSLVVPATGDYDMYVYSDQPDSYGNPVIVKKSVNAGAGVAESISYVPGTSGGGYLVIKRVSGSGTWSLAGAVPVSLSGFELSEYR